VSFLIAVFRLLLLSYMSKCMYCIFFWPEMLLTSEVGSRESMCKQ
jgi:hypothetical protein